MLYISIVWVTPIFYSTPLWISPLWIKGNHQFKHLAIYISSLDSNSQSYILKTSPSKKKIAKIGSFMCVEFTQNSKIHLYGPVLIFFLIQRLECCVKPKK